MCMGSGQMTDFCVGTDLYSELAIKLSTLYSVIKSWHNNYMIVGF